MHYYAHTKENEPPEKWQLLDEHLANVAELAAKFAKAFNAEEWGRIAGQLHDIGKASKQFQEYLKGEAISGGDHSTAGAKTAVKQFGDQVGKLLAYIISGHHSGLPNGKDETGASLYARLTKDVNEYIEPSIKTPPSYEELPFISNLNGFNVSFFIRMLYSSLVDADFLDTEKFMNADAFVDRNVRFKLEDLWLKLEKHISALNPESSFINKRRHEILKASLDAAQKPQGFFSLTVPTGGGKTISSLAFAMKHALQHGLERIIYVIPYTSIIEQNAQVFRDILGDDAVLEHHSNFDPEKETRFSKLATQNWDAPVVVTTNVQFFESLFADRSSRCRKLHNIANSVVILDEAQMLPLNLLQPCLEAMKALVDGYHTTLLFCTATQPVLKKTKEFKIGIEDVTEIIPNTEELYRAFKRVSVTFEEEPLSDETLAERLANEKQGLCIVSNKRQARNLYDLLQEDGVTYHLSSMMCPEHRTEKLKRIKERLKEGKDCRVVSTQLIEAGVDIDFPVVFRAVAGVDSIAQAAGRCNREGMMMEGEVRIFKPENPNDIPPGFLRLSSQIGEQVLNHHKEDVLSLDSVKEYFQRLYWQNSDRLDEKDICSDLERDLARLNFPFREIAERFTIINSATYSIIIPFGERGKEVCEEIRNSYLFLDQSVALKVQRLSVQIHPMVFNKLRAAGVVEGFLDEKYWILNNPDIYHEEMGLLPDDPEFYKVDTLMI